MRYSNESKKSMLNEVGYFENESGSRFKVIKKFLNPAKILRYDLEDPNSTTDFDFRKNMSSNVSWRKSQITKTSTLINKKPRRDILNLSWWYSLI